MSKKGKSTEQRPGTTRKQAANAAFDPGFNIDPYALSDDLKKELDDKGFVGRFVNIEFMKRNGGYHPRGWRPYKRETLEDSEYTSLFGRDQDGYVRRGESILAVKTKEEVERHKAYLAHQAQLCSHKNYMKKSKQEMKDRIRSQGLQDHVKVLDGYEE